MYAKKPCLTVDCVNKWGDSEAE